MSDSVVSWSSHSQHFLNLLHQLSHQCVGGDLGTAQKGWPGPFIGLHATSNKAHASKFYTKWKTKSLLQTLSLIFNIVFIQFRPGKWLLDLLSAFYSFVPYFIMIQPTNIAASTSHTFTIVMLMVNTRILVLMWWLKWQHTFLVADTTHKNINLI